jgi:2,4-dienoyl-CoA reductase-like NADH-dependent reductase (Old Yellow Enzyme family)
MNPHFPRLFEPIRIGKKTSRNRVMRLATTTNSGANGVASERTIAIYRAVARGGSGMLVTESMRVHPSNGGRAAAMLAYRKEIVPGLAQLAGAAHAENALLIVQINHGGRQHHSNLIPNLWGPSAIACPHSGGIPHAMTREEIAEVVRGFATAARHAREAGTDGVEIHGAQGHLIQEFISPFSNQRSDEYGGSPENRLRFAREIIDAVRAAVGPDFIVGYRMGVEEFTAGGITIDDSIEIAQQLVALGEIDYLSLAQGNFNTLDTHVPDAHYPPLAYVDLHARVKAVAGTIPVIASSRIQTPEQAESVLASGKADVIGLCRALIADPEWPLKAQSGRASDIRRCISINQCWGWTIDSRRLACSINPTVGNELELPPLARVAAPKRVVVVGGGPGGLEAARAAAECGHDVILFETQDALGGKLRWSKHLLPQHETVYAVEYLIAQVTKLGVKVRLGKPATVQTVAAEKPDAVIVATGASIIAPEVRGDGSVPVLAATGKLPDGAPSSAIVLMDEDGYYWAASIAGMVARRGRKLIYVTRFFEALREVPEVSRIPALRDLDQLGVAIHATMFVDRIEKGGVVLKHYYNNAHEVRIDGVSAVLWAGLQRVNDDLVAELRQSGLANVRVVGDAVSPRRLANAIAEGHRAARAV